MIKSNKIKRIRKIDVRRLFCTDERYERSKGIQKVRIDKKAEVLLKVSKLNIQTLEHYLRMNYHQLAKKLFLEQLDRELLGIRLDMPLE